MATGEFGVGNIFPRTHHVSCRSQYPDRQKYADRLPPVTQHCTRKIQDSKAVARGVRHRKTPAAYAAFASETVRFVGELQNQICVDEPQAPAP